MNICRYFFAIVIFTFALLIPTAHSTDLHGKHTTLFIRITGTVTDSTGSAVSGVSISVKGTSKGTITDGNGRFSLAADAGDVLVISSSGYSPQEITVNDQTIYNVVLSAATSILNEVVVTALGIERKAKSVSYATQNISGAELTKVKDPNLMNALAGKAAGVVITKGNGGPGASSKVLLRGNKSISGNNQPLYVIDGIPMNVNANGVQGNSLSSFNGARDGGDNISNLNPEDIESINVLKGASAAALYGGNAANGVILITTKKGTKGVSAVNVSSTYTFENPVALPDKQTSYGQGFGGVANKIVNDSWGEKITTGSEAYLKDFFQTGKSLINTISVTSGNNMGQFYLSYANTNASGIVPNNDYNRHNINLRGTTQLFNSKVILDGSFNYINQQTENRPWAGNFFNPIFGLYLFPTGDDFSKYSGDNYQVFSNQRNMYLQNWPYFKNEASSNQNPLWIQNKNLSDERRDRAVYTISARWNIVNGLHLQARTTYDKITDNYELRHYAGSDPLLVGLNGAYRKQITTNDQLYSDILLSGNTTFKNISLAGNIGFSNTSNTFYDLSISNDGANNTLLFANVFSVQNLVPPFQTSENLRKKLDQAVFATSTIGFKEFIFLDITGRNEWSSTVNQSFLYPSVGLSYVLSEHLPVTRFLSFVKLRGSFAEVGNSLAFGVNSFFPPRSITNGAAGARDSKPLIELVPERTRSYEGGADMRFLDDKLSLNLTYYNATTLNQVFNILAPPGSGVVNYTINGGTIRNKGIEATLSYNGSFGKLKWTPAINFSKNVNQILALSNLLNAQYFVLTNSGQTRMIQLLLARPGIPNLKGRAYGSYGDLFGKTYVRDSSGNITYAANGLPVLSANPDQYIGNANPDFLIGINNQFNYKNLFLSFLVDGRFGGEIVAMSEQWLDFKGQSQRTADARDAGGVMVNGKLIPAETYYNYISGKGDVAAAAEEYVYDATNIRIRELAIGYTLPLLTKALKNLNVSFVARNIGFLYKKAPFDPEVSISTANGLQGVEGFASPATRSFGFSLKATF